jgi:thioredoxin-like negative regulator of GroEL
MVAYAQGKNAEAVRAYETAVQLEPGAADLHAALGDVRQATGDLRAAETAYRALRLDASAARGPRETRQNTGPACSASKRPAAAPSSGAVQLDPANAEANFELGKAALARGDHAAAVDQLRRARSSRRPV